MAKLGFPMFMMLVTVLGAAMASGVVEVHNPVEGVGLQAVQGALGEPVGGGTEPGKPDVQGGPVLPRREAAPDVGGGPAPVVEAVRGTEPGQPATEGGERVEPAWTTGAGDENRCVTRVTVELHSSPEAGFGMGVRVAADQALTLAHVPSGSWYLVEVNGTRGWVWALDCEVVQR